MWKTVLIFAFWQTPVPADEAFPTNPLLNASGELTY